MATEIVLFTGKIKNIDNMSKLDGVHTPISL